MATCAPRPAEACRSSAGGLRLWRVPQPVRPSPQNFKYALFYGRAGERLVLYDNERGKGDHQHIREVETPYAFTTPEQLIADFPVSVRAFQEEERFSGQDSQPACRK